MFRHNIRVVTCSPTEEPIYGILTRNLRKRLYRLKTKCVKRRGDRERRQREERDREDEREREDGGERGRRDREDGERERERGGEGER